MDMELSTNIDSIMADVFNLEIARELLIEVNKDITDAEVESVMSKCGGNPWNAKIMYQLLNKGKLK